VILRADIVVPKADAYIVAARRIPAGWSICNKPNLSEFVRAYPGWGYYVTGGVESSWRGGVRLLHEAEATGW
jgi:hypothetical protein